MRTNRPLGVYAVGSWHGASSRAGMFNATFAAFLVILAAIPVALVAHDLYRAVTGADKAEAVMAAARFQASRAGKKLPR